MNTQRAHAATIIAGACPGFRPLGRSWRSLKSHLLLGEYRGQLGVAKVLLSPDPLWRWYFRREVALYRRFTEARPPLPVARLLDADPEAGVLLLSYLPGQPLATGRYATNAPDNATLTALLAALERLHGWEAGPALVREPAIGDAPPPSIRRVLRLRLLEDPSAGPGWFTDGLRRCHDLGLVAAADAERVAAALAGAPLVPSHGDLLPRNALALEGGGVALLDWECAGLYPAGWDAALLWVGLPGPARDRIEQAHVGDDLRRRPPLLACVAFALLRELKLLRGYDGASAAPVQATLAAVLGRLRDLAGQACM